MLTIYLCVGSSCYVRGSEQVAQSLQSAVAKHHLHDKVDIVGTFCLEHCSMGVTVKVDGEVFSEVFPETVDAFFETEIVPRLEGRQGVK